ncbi:MAG: nitrilase-related carbon-nitrogen hydrolase [Arhodomonas sp.]|nr:nitrilase-related carbon-nitrogen hydrolase [Arhodomonas sp.]
MAAVETNLQRHAEWITAARNAGVELLVFPELSLTGYALGRNALAVAMRRDDARLGRLAEASGAMTTTVGFVEEAAPGELFNAAAVLRDGRVIAVHRKVNPPTYGGLGEGKIFGRDGNHGRRSAPPAGRSPA